MKDYSTQDVAALLGMPERRIRAYARAGFIAPARGASNEYIFSFQDLVLLRTAAELARARVPARRITEALAQLKAQLPADRPLSHVRIDAAGGEVVVRESSEPPWNPSSGQFHIEFDMDELAPVTPLQHAVPDDAGDDDEPATAQEWFELGIELEPVAPDEACRAYEAALQADAAHADARVNLGRLLHDAGRVDEAEQAYRTVLAAQEHALAAYNLGVLLESRKRVAEAIMSYNQAIAADAQLAEAHYNLARLYEQRGDERAAIRHFNGYRELTRRR